MGFEASALSKSLPREGRSGIFAKSAWRWKDENSHAAHTLQLHEEAKSLLSRWMDGW